MDPSLEHGGFKPTLLLGISRGGIIVADILSRMMADRELGLLNADRDSVSGQVLFNDDQVKPVLIRHIERFVWDSTKEIRVLVVDDVMKSGISLEGAVTTVRICMENLLESKSRKWDVKSLVLVARGDHTSSRKKHKPDYCLANVDERTSIILPYGLG